MMLDMKFLLLFFVICWIKQSDSQCSFPTQFLGVWKGADRGDMRFVNSTALYQFKMNIPMVTYFDFICQQQRGSIYFLKAVQENQIFGTIVKFYMCLEMHAVSSDIGYYYTLTESPDPVITDPIVGDATNTASFDSVCNTPLVTRNFITIVRDGAVAAGRVNISCPHDLQAQFGNVSIKHQAATEAIICPGTWLDVCSYRTYINITYNDTCATTDQDKTLSAAGVYRCIHSITDAYDTFLSVWNEDAIADPFSCFAFRRIDDVVYATETPGFCEKETNSSVAGPSGVKLVIHDIIGTCKTSVPSNTEAPNLALFALLILPILLLLFLLLLLIRFCCYHYGCICARIKRKKKDPPIVDDGTGRPDVVGNITFKPSVLKPPKQYNFRPKKQLDNFFPLFDPNWSPIKLPNLIPITKVEPLYDDTLDDYLREQLPRSPSGNSLYSFNSGTIILK